MRAALTGLRLATCGAKNQMNGSVSNPIRAVNMRRTATLLFLKYFSTRYLTKWVEMAQRTGPEKAKASQDIDIRLKGTSKNCHRSAGAPSLPANDSALFSFRFCVVHPKDVRDCQLQQFFEVP